MKNVISLRDLEQMVRIRTGSAQSAGGRDSHAVGAGFSAGLGESGGWQVGRQLLRPPAPAAGAKPAPPTQDAHLEERRRRNSRRSSTRLTRTSLKEQICEMGHRLWKRAYVDGNGGNMAIRVGEDIAICTPTLVSKGSLKPEDMCLVDFEGNQLLGAKKRTSEILMHLQMMKRQPKAVATCHCHPPYATAFAVAGIAPPTCMFPEYEVFCVRRRRAVSHAGLAGDGQARRRPGGPVQHHPHGQPRRRDLEPQQHRGSLLAHGDHRGLLPHARGGRATRQAAQHLHAGRR